MFVGSVLGVRFVMLLLTCFFILLLKIVILPPDLILIANCFHLCFGFIFIVLFLDYLTFRLFPTKITHFYSSMQLMKEHYLKMAYQKSDLQKRVEIHSNYFQLSLVLQFTKLLIHFLRTNYRFQTYQTHHQVFVRIIFDLVKDLMLYAGLWAVGLLLFCIHKLIIFLQ